MQTPSGAGGSPDAIIQPLILDFLHWLDAEPRAYSEVMEFWRTSCPRLTVWEDAVDGGLIERRRDPGAPVVVLTVKGRRALRSAAAS